MANQNVRNINLQRQTNASEPLRMNVDKTQCVAANAQYYSKRPLIDIEREMYVSLTSE